MKDNYSIEEILNAVSEIQNIKNKKKEEKNFIITIIIVSRQFLRIHLE